MFLWMIPKVSHITPLFRRLSLLVFLILADDMYGAALRGLFLVDPAGKVRSIQINDDAVGRSPEETLRTLKAFQYADSHEGEACPASWTPGEDTIKTDPFGAKEYFKTHN